MTKLIFILVLAIEGSGVATIEFESEKECEAAGLTKMKRNPPTFVAYACIEKHVKIEKSKVLKCDIMNKTDYSNGLRHTYSAQNMLGYPYPVGFVCKEE